MLWVLIWLVLALGAALVFFLIGRRLWRQLKALTAELRTASDRLAEINDRLAQVDTHPGQRPARRDADA